MILNGKNVDLNEKITIEEFLESQNYNVKTVAVEKNGEIIAKAEFSNVFLENEDKVEVVSFVGGG